MLNLFKRKDNKPIVFRVEIDNKKLPKAVCDEQEKRDSFPQSENELQSAITSAILNAYEQKEKSDIEKQEKERSERIKKRTESIWSEDCFDKEGRPKKIIKFLWEFSFAKEKDLKDCDVIGPTVNSVVSLFFLVIEWLLYFISFCLFVKGACNIISFFENIANEIEWTLLWTFGDYILFAVVTFLISRTLIRVLKIECKYNKDSNYMLNFLAVIVAIVALIVSAR